MACEGRGSKDRWTIIIERREDGGLRVWSDNVPGFVLSHRDKDAVLSDLGLALKVFLDEFAKSEEGATP